MLSTLISITLFSTALAAISLSVTPATDNVLVNTLIDCQWTASSSDPDTFNIVMEWDPSFLEQALVTTVHRGAATSGTVSNIPNVHILGIHRVAAFSEQVHCLLIIKKVLTVARSPYVTTSQPLALSDTFEVVDTLPESSTAVATSAPHTTSTTTTSTPTTADSTPTSVRDSNGSSSSHPQATSTTGATGTTGATAKVGATGNTNSSPSSSGGSLVSPLPSSPDSQSTETVASNVSTTKANNKTGTIVGIIVALVVIVAIIIAILLWRRRKRRNAALAQWLSADAMSDHPMAERAVSDESAVYRSYSPPTARPDVHSPYVPDFAPRRREEDTDSEARLPYSDGDDSHVVAHKLDTALAEIQTLRQEMRGLREQYVGDTIPPSYYPSSEEAGSESQVGQSLAASSDSKRR